MNIEPYIFAGPTISWPECHAILPQAHCLAPIQCGDILQALKQGAKQIVIIDGVFEQMAAVWHKEILLAIEEGVRVYGASSMGALRAAELSDFGMIGYGQVYQDFKRGVLEDDDEVTVLHKPQPSHYALMSDAMVNIRATIAHGVEKGIISAQFADSLLDKAKQTHYKQRHLDKLLGAYDDQQAVALRDFIAQTGNYIDIKKQDAKGLLSALATQEITDKSTSQLQLHKTVSLVRLDAQMQCQDLITELTQFTQLPKNYLGLFVYATKCVQQLYASSLPEMVCFTLDWLSQYYADHISCRQLYQLCELLLQPKLPLKPYEHHFILMLSYLLDLIKQYLVNENILFSLHTQQVYVHEISDLLKITPQELCQLLARLEIDSEIFVLNYALIPIILQVSAERYLSQVTGLLRLNSQYMIKMLRCLNNPP